MKMERIEISEMSALKAQTPGDYTKNTIRHSTHGESLKSRTPCRRISKYGVADRRRTSKIANKKAGKSAILKLCFNTI